MNKRSLVSITDYSKEDILEVLKIASEFEKNSYAFEFRNSY